MRLPGIISALVQGIITLLPMILTAAVQLITTLAFGIIQNVPLLIKAIAQAISNIINIFKTTDWKTIGKNLVDGISSGFMAQWNAFKANVIAGFNSMVSFIKTLLGIASPSTVFAGIGLNMAAGLGIGFTRELANVQRQINGMVGGGFGLQPVLAGGMGMSSNDNSQRFAFYGPVTIAGAQGQSMGQAIKAKRW